MEKFRCSPPEPPVVPESLSPLDVCTVGLLVIGLRASLNPEKYGDSPFIKNAVDTVKYAGYVTDEGINAPIDLMAIAFPNGDINQ